MWILAADGDLLHGKKLWLRPGKRFIFGRTAKTEDGQFMILDKTISRQHLVVEVGTAEAADSHDANSRSTLKLTDRDTKIGTLVNGEQIRGKSYEVFNPENVVKLGKYPGHLTFTWVPVNLSFSFTLKETRSDPYSALGKTFGPLDIKVLTEYERGITTHLVAKKRNTSKGLQALIHGKYIVHNDSYIKALVAACTAPADGAGSQSPLEEDFDKNFPDPLLYLPPRGDEPTQRDATAYSPNSARQNIFEGYTFVFYEKRQYENLLAPVTEGGGKALFHPVVPNETTVDEFVGFVKGCAGEKGLTSFEDGSEGKGVVIVRFNPKEGPGSDWYVDFNREVSLHLDHRLIEQSDFLDAILGNDASVLRRPLEFAQSGVVVQPPLAMTSSEAPRSSPPSPPAPDPLIAPPEPFRRGKSRRGLTGPRFQGFTEEFTGANLTSVPESIAIDSPPAAESHSPGLFVSQDFRVNPEDSQPTDTRIGSRKRDTPQMDYEDNEDVMDNVAPAAQAFKKRKLLEEVARKQRGESTPPPAAQTSTAEKPMTKKKASKEIDVQEILIRKQAEEAEKAAQELARTEREALQETLEGMSIDEIRHLAIVEEMPVVRKAPPPRVTAHADESDRWEERWNGRKNFKKFRRRGADQNERRVAGRVIVQLEEVKEKDFGIGDEYWLEGDDDSLSQLRKKGRGKDTQETHSQSQARQPKARGKERATHILESEDEDASPDNDEIEPPVPRPAAEPQRGQKLTDKTNESQKLSTHRGSKRPAATALTAPPPAKKPKPAPVVVDASDDDSDDDGLKFRFARRR